MTARPWCCPEPRCTPVHALRGGDKPLDQPDPGESFLCFGAAPEVAFTYDGVEHINDARSCSYTPLKGVISFQENADDWLALQNAYGRASRALELHRRPAPVVAPSAEATRADGTAAPLLDDGAATTALPTNPRSDSSQ